VVLLFLRCSKSIGVGLGGGYFHFNSHANDKQLDKTYRCVLWWYQHIKIIFKTTKACMIIQEEDVKSQVVSGQPKNPSAFSS
jgi:hypothetical protein